MYRYDFNQMNEDDFEALVIAICNEVMGIGVHSFAKGRDGGKDGFFSGTAQSYPSTSNPWCGNFIIQAKHTTVINASCSDNDFFANQTSVLNKEIKRLSELKNNHEIDFDNYLIFTNRKLTGGIHPQIVKHLQTNLGIQYADVVGEEDLTRYVENHPKLIKRFQLLKYLLPNQFYDADIRDVIVLFSQNTDWIDTPPIKDDSPFDYSDKEKKNALNGVDHIYFDEIKSHSLRYFAKIDKFLKNPINQEYLLKYVNTAADLRGYVQRHLATHSFVEIIESIIENIVGADALSNIHKVRALVRVFVHYMYWNCDIGRKE